MMWGGRGAGDQPGKKPSLVMYRRLLTFVGPYKGNLFISAVLLVISTALGLVWPQVVRQVIDFGLGDGSFLDILIVVIALVVFGAADIGSGGDASAILDTVLGALFLLLGVMAVFSRESPEKDAAQRQQSPQSTSVRPRVC